jgi:hypothetical protein
MIFNSLLWHTAAKVLYFCIREIPFQKHLLILALRYKSRGYSVDWPERKWQRVSMGKQTYEKEQTRVRFDFTADSFFAVKFSRFLKIIESLASLSTSDLFADEFTSSSFESLILTELFCLVFCVLKILTVGRIRTLLDRQTS